MLRQFPSETCLVTQKVLDFALLTSAPYLPPTHGHPTGAPLLLSPSSASLSSWPPSSRALRDALANSLRRPRIWKGLASHHTWSVTGPALGPRDPVPSPGLQPTKSSPSKASSCDAVAVKSRTHIVGFLSPPIKPHEGKKTQLGLPHPKASLGLQFSDLSPALFHSCQRHSGSTVSVGTLLNS